jgi:hypothetical protein
MSYYNLCGIGSQHSNISKGKGEVHIKITGMQNKGCDYVSPLNEERQIVLV